MMAQIKSLKELADLGFVIAFRFYGRYPETGLTFYHPPAPVPACESENERRHSPAHARGAHLLKLKSAGFRWM